MTTAADRARAAKLAWATTKLTRVGEHPVALDVLAAAVGVQPAEARRLAELVGFVVEEDQVAMDRSRRGPSRHRSEVDGRVLDTGRGCGVDVFLVALATGERVRTESVCPATGRRITIELTPDEVVSVEPSTAVVAVVDLTDVDLTRGAEHIDAQICAEQPFFADAGAAAGWLAGHPGGRVHPVPAYLAEARRMVAALES